jgi:DNA-binding transcriptional ArsR family regulator
MCFMTRADPDLVFRALADPTRRAVLEMLSPNECNVAEIQDAFDLSQPAISQHLKVLREAGLVVSRWQGRERYYRTNARPLKAVFDWAGHFRGFWAEGLDRLGSVLREEKRPRVSRRKRSAKGRD